MTWMKIFATADHSAATGATQVCVMINALPVGIHARNTIKAMTTILNAAWLVAGVLNLLINCCEP